MDDKEFRDLMDDEARAAEEAPDEDDGQPPIPRVTVSRPNRARSKVLQVRLNPDEFEAIERIAEARELPVSTVAREQLLKLLEVDEATLRTNLTLLIDAAGHMTMLAREFENQLAHCRVSGVYSTSPSECSSTRG